jgi:hypothetical protein
MKNSCHTTRTLIRHTRMPTAWAQDGVAFMVALLLLVGGARIAKAQSDDFNDGNDSGWTRYDPGSQLTFAGAPFNVPGVYSFPSGGYRLQGNAFPVAFDAGPARVGSYWDNVIFTNGQMGIDLVSWDSSLETAFGFILRVSNVGLGSTMGYTVNYLNASGSLEINRVASEASEATVGTTPCSLDPAGGPYRMIAEAYNNLIVGRIFRASDLSAPIASVIGDDWTHPEGKAGLFAYDDGPAIDMTSALDVTFDNYSAVALPKYRPLVTGLQPRPYSMGAPILPAIQVAVLDRQTTVDTTSIILIVNGAAVPSSSLTITPEVLQPGNPTPFPGATVTYTPSSLPNLSDTQTNRVVFRDSDGVFQTNTWSYKFAALDPANAAPIDRGANPGFDVRFVITSTNVPALTNLPNNLARALTQLGPKPPPGWADFQSNVIAAVINYTQKDTNTGTDGMFTSDANFPGIDPVVNPDPQDCAMELRTFLELPAGAYTVGITSDDGFQLTAGNGFTDPAPLLLGEKTSGTFDGTLDFATTKSGLYPIKLVWFEQEGGANVEFWVQDRANPDTRWLVNDPAGPIKAYRSVIPAVLSASKAGGIFNCSVWSYTGLKYTLQHKNSVSDGSWTSLAPVDGNGGTLSLSDTNAGVPARIYRVAVQ